MDTEFYGLGRGDAERSECPPCCPCLVVYVNIAESH